MRGPEAGLADLCLRALGDREGPTQAMQRRGRGPLEQCIALGDPTLAERAAQLLGS